MGKTRDRLTRRQFLARVMGAGGVVVLGGSSLLGCGPSASPAAPTKAPAAPTTAPAAPTKAPAAAPTQAPPAAKKFVFRLSHSHAPDAEQSAIHIMALKFQELAAKKTNNQAEIQIFPANQLGEERVVVEGVKMGTIDMMSSGTAIWVNFAPKLGVLDLPYVFKEFDHVHKLLDGPAGEELAKHVEQSTGARVLGWYDSFGFRNVGTKSKEVKKLEDLKGLKIRVIQTPTYVRTFELLGASPTPMAFGEVYTSIQTGVLDGWEHDPPTMVTQKMYEVTKYVARTEHLFGVLLLTVNAKKLDALPADVKKGVEEAAREACNYARSLAPEKEQAALKVLKDKGMVINDFDKAQAVEKVRGYWKEYADKVNAGDLLAKLTG